MKQVVKVKQDLKKKKSRKTKALTVIKPNKIKKIEPVIKTIETVTKEKISEYLTAFNMTSLTPQEQKQFSEIAVAFQLNPFKREIYCIPYTKSVKDTSGKWIKERALSIITGYEVYLKRAERTGKVNGWRCEIIGNGDAMKAVATIYRKDWKNPFIHEVYFEEVAQKSDEGTLRSLWKKMPKFMLKKVCIAQAFRLCFPDEFGGIPYIADEMPNNMTDINYIELPKITDSGGQDLAEDLIIQDEQQIKKEEEAIRIKKVDEEAIIKLNALPDKIQVGFKTLGYTKKAVWTFCEDLSWDKDKILEKLNHIMK
jgi:phage recombination protein Bet